MQRLFACLTDIGSMTCIRTGDAPVAEFDSLAALFKNNGILANGMCSYKTYEHEKFITQKIND